MNDSRYASLSGSLLARKGGARPAMRPRPLSSPQMLDDLGWDDMGDHHDDAHEHVPSSISALTPAPKVPQPAREEPPHVHLQQRTLAERYEQPAPAPAPAPAPQPAPEPAAAAPAEKPILPDAVVAALKAPAPRGKARKTKAEAGRKAAFTLRLDADRHLRLRLASALTGRSSQQLVTSALDAFIESLPEVGVLAQQVPARAGANS